MSTHTPGPWTFRSPYIVTSGGIITTIKETKYNRANEANARLIAAAPDLLDLAHNVGGFDDGLLLTCDLNVLRQALREWRDAARAAIAKAEGTS